MDLDAVAGVAVDVLLTEADGGGVNAPPAPLVVTALPGVLLLLPAAVVERAGVRAAATGVLLLLLLLLPPAAPPSPPPVANSRRNRNSSNLVNSRRLMADILTKIPHWVGQSKYFWPWTVPSFRPSPTDDPVNRTPTQSSPSANLTGPKKATTPSSWDPPSRWT